MLADLVKINNNQIEGTVGSTYRVFPNIIIDFVSKARRNSGYRLCKRACRHALDPKSSDIFFAKGKIIKYISKMGLLIHHEVRASMKNGTYFVSVAFTSNTIVACSCTCKAGSSNNEKTICVHILPIHFQITQCLYKFMAENILIELANFWKSGDKKKIWNLPSYQKWHQL